eukprot:TRINITY_DN10670_c0_g1_i13.p1 TRINITY_DN10670_c0_g1~~TRINITY_DN10670_c0_g1_i13.p1  ORF type:complete len:111 (-),score=32.92 TRINITY_DN10670_c0_g1_i13:110-442(-)
MGMEEEGKVVKMQMDDGTNKRGTFTFTGEDHTLGNLLRSTIIKNKKTEFCAYSVPHPSENIMNVRVQANDGTAIEITKKALERISKVCDVISEKFTAELAKYKNNLMQDV